jgi:hypothetical protein
VGVPEGKRPLGIPRCTWEDNFKKKFQAKYSGPGLSIYLLAYKDETDRVFRNVDI